MGVGHLEGLGSVGCLRFALGVPGSMGAGDSYLLKGSDAFRFKMTFEQNKTT